MDLHHSLVRFLVNKFQCNLLMTIVVIRNAPTVLDSFCFLNNVFRKKTIWKSSISALFVDFNYACNSVVHD